MLRNLLLHVYRSLTRNKLSTTVNIFSFALGLTIFAFTYFYVTGELSRDWDWPNGHKVHRLTIERRGIPSVPDGVDSRISTREYNDILNFFGNDIAKSTRLLSSATRVKDFPSAVFTPLTFVDPDFNDIFQLELVEGDLALTLSRPGFVALEETYARTLGAAGELGSRLTLEGTPGEMNYEVGAIFRLPENISRTVQFSQLTLIHDSSMPLFRNATEGPWVAGSQMWIALNEGVNTSDFNLAQPNFVRNHTEYATLIGEGGNIEEHLFLRWQPLREIYFNPVGFEGPGGDWSRVLIFAAVGALALLVGCSNSVSLNLASALERKREIGVHKTSGAVKSDILIQQFCVAIASALLALVLAIWLLHSCIPLFEQLMPFNPNLYVPWKGYIVLTGISCVFGLLSNAYPAMSLSSLKPQAALAPSSALVNGKLGTRTLLVAFQFFFASMLLIATFSLYLQLRVISSQPLGFNPQNLVFLQLTTDQERANNNALRTQLERLPAVKLIGPSFLPPNSNLPAALNSAMLSREGESSNGVPTQMLAVDFSFFDMMEISVLAGRVFDPLRDSTDAKTQQSIDGNPKQIRLVINRAASKALGFSEPESAVDQSILFNARSGAGSTTNVSASIIGVVEDNMYMSLFRKPGPELYQLAETAAYSNLMLRYEEPSEPQLQEMINQVSVEINGSPLQRMFFIEPRLDSAFLREQNEGKLLLLCATLALTLGGVGLFAVTMFSVKHRIKELGIRKALGASTASITRLFLWQFCWPTLLGTLAGWPLAIYGVLQWIERFPYQLDKFWLLPVCIAVTVLVLLINVFTVGSVTFTTVRRNVASSLRYE